MIAPFILLLFSLVGLGVAVAVPQLRDLILLAGPCAVASLILLLRAGFAPAALAPRPTQKWVFPRRINTDRKKPQNWVVIDGSNVMHWKDGTPQIETLREVVHHLKSLGFSPGVVFDANAGHRLTGKYQHHLAMGHHLGLPEDRVMVVDKGTPADPIILAAARDLGARIVTNDRYKDWADLHPEVGTAGHLIKGGYHDGKLWLDLKDPSSPRPGVSKA